MDDIEFVEQGHGPAILFVPGSFATPAAWRAIQKRLPDGYRTVATSLRGYGITAETRTLDDLGMEHEIEVVEATAARIGEPVILVGHSFGGTVALASALAGRFPVRAIATFEANPLALISESATPALHDEGMAMSRAFEAAHLSGERDAAGRIIDYWGGTGSFAALPPPVRDFCRATTYSNVLDWRTAFSFHATGQDYARLAMPTLIVRGELANPAMIAITDVLSASLPRGRTAVVEGASHFLIATHADACAELLSGFLSDL
jgi:lipase